MIKKPCLKCIISEMEESEEYEKIKELLDEIPESLKASDIEYKRRIGICKACDRLVEGTCLLCGCYVELRAVQKNGKCPAKSWKKQ